MKNHTRALGISTAIAVILLPLVASAQERPQRPKPADQGWTVSAGGGVLVSPNYLGDDSYGVSTVPYIRVTYADKFEATVQDGARYNLVNNENFRAGPLATLDFGRNEDGSGAFRVIGDDTNDLIGLGDIEPFVPPLLVIGRVSGQPVVGVRSASVLEISGGEICHRTLQCSMEFVFSVVLLERQRRARQNLLIVHLDERLPC